MFSYISRELREQLEGDRRLVDLDRQGRPTHDGAEEPPYLKLLGPIPLPRLFAAEEVLLHWYTFVRRVELGAVLEVANAAQRGNGGVLRDLLQTNMCVNSLLVLPGCGESAAPLVRVHSCCMTGDVFGSRRCECGPQLAAAFEQIRAGGGGAVVYMSGHEGRGIGLWAKAITYLLQDDGQDTYEANLALGLPEDSRDFHDAGVVLRYLLGERPIRLLSNNPLKRQHLQESGVAIAEIVPLLTGVCDHNRRYMQAKRGKGHLLPEDL